MLLEKRCCTSRSKNGGLALPFRLVGSMGGEREKSCSVPALQLGDGQWRESPRLRYRAPIHGNLVCMTDGGARGNEMAAAGWPISEFALAPTILSLGKLLLGQKAL